MRVFVGFVFALMLVFTPWGACVVEGYPCDPGEPADLECDDGNDCTIPYCKRVWTMDCTGTIFERDESDYWCRYSHVIDGTPCLALGKKDGACQAGVCRPTDLEPSDPYDAGGGLIP